MTTREPTPKPAKKPYEAELDAMKRIGKLLSELPDVSTRERVAAWIAQNFGANGG